MPKITKECINSINSVSLHRIFPGLQGSGMTLNGKCPLCGAEGKKKSKWQGLWVKDDPVKNVHMAGCNSCKEKAGGGSVNVAMKFFNLEFLKACEFIAKESGIEIEYEEERKRPTASAKPEKNSFCARQLAESGLTPEDVMVKAIDGDETYMISPFRKGSLDVMTGAIDEKADEMLILYFDLEGRRRKCIPSRFKTREAPYTRVRWSIPESHTNRNGKTIKYQTIAGSKSELYITQKIRDYYKNHQKFETLFIQEGEKKAEKACKHGLPSIAIQGIGNIGRKDEGLPAEIQYLVQRCEIKNIVLLMDSDWIDLHRRIIDDSRVDSRPWDFARALIKFKKFVQTLALSGINVDVWFAHVNKNENGDKGIDDLLCNTLKGKEDLLRPSVEKAMLSVDGAGEYIDIINVTSWSDQKIKNLWHLNSAEDFFKAHRQELLSLHSFQFGGVFYKNIDGEFVIASEIGTGSQFWCVSETEKGKMEVDLKYINLKDFLNSNGFRSRKLDDGKRGLVKIDSGVIRIVDEYDIRYFLLNYIYRATKSLTVHEYFTENISSKVPVSFLYLLDQLEVITGKRRQHSQRFYFKDCEAEITASGIELTKFVGPVWEENQVQRNFERIKIFQKFEPDGAGSFTIIPTDDGAECDFYRFICNVSNNFTGAQMDAKANADYRRHIANKVTAIGYLLRDCKTPTERKAVVAMDSKMSKVGFSSGRTGKSFIGEAISKFISQAFIDGRKLSNDDQYMYSGVSRQTANIMIDDVKENFCFKNLYTDLSGKLNVNIKQGARFEIPFEESPKIYITTNHALSDLDDSARARIIFMSFSNWYSSSYSPRNEFGHYFFSEWDDRQWLLFDNFMLECIMLYMRSLEKSWEKDGEGAIAPPMENIHLRELRQEMGEQFLSWAEVYFSPESGHLNSRIARKDIYESMLNEYNIKSTQFTAKTFRDKIFAYCKFAGLNFNAHRRNAEGFSFQDWKTAHPDESFIGSRDVSGPTEYFTISTQNFNSDEIYRF